MAQVVHSVQSITFALPQEAIKIANTNLNPNNIKDQTVIKYENIYKIDDMYFAITHPATGTMSNDHLDVIKTDHDRLMIDLEFVEVGQYKSSLEKINNNKVLIYYSFYDNVGDYFFMVLKNDNSEIFSGRIAFENQLNYTEATEILDNFLISVQFE
jgi:hypothetical protein